MNLEFISRANAIVQDLEERGLTGTAKAMRQVVIDYEACAKESHYIVPLSQQFGLLLRS